MADTSVSERDQLLRQRIAAMTPDDFEQLTFELVRGEEPTARRILAPDAGADVLRPSSGEQAAKVWQAKRHKEINWTECEGSLATAITRYSPSEIVFVFSRDLSEAVEETFNAKLVRHPDAVATETPVVYWNLSEIVRRLGQHQEIRVRFFGGEQESTLDLINRTIKAGGPLESAADLVERATALTEWTERDQKFTHAVTTSAGGRPEPKWDELPYMMLTVGGASSQVNIASWPRAGANVALPLFGFDDTEEGNEARQDAVEQLAHGEAAEIVKGANVQIDAPEIVSALAPPESLQAGVFKITPGDAITLEIEVANDADTSAWAVPLYNVPPPPGATGALAGWVGAVLVHVSVRLLESPRVSIELGLSARFGEDIRANAEAIELLHAIYRSGEVTLHSEILFPSGQVTDALARDRAVDEGKLNELVTLKHIFGSLAMIGDKLGLEIAPPPSVSKEDVEVLMTITCILTTREGTAEFNGMTGVVAPSDIPWIAEQLAGTEHQRAVTYPLFGREISIGVGAYVLPQLKVVEVIPHGLTPDAPARVVLGADGDPTMRFHLL